MKKQQQTQKIDNQPLMVPAGTWDIGNQMIACVTQGEHKNNNEPTTIDHPDNDRRNLKKQLQHATKQCCKTGNGK